MMFLRRVDRFSVIVQITFILFQIQAKKIVQKEIAANYEKHIRARDPFPWRSIHQNLNYLGIFFRFAPIQI